jgi:uncharacterized membrane protein YdjX (TVP38/TMEM64 family)
MSKRLIIFIGALALLVTASFAYRYLPVEKLHWDSLSSTYADLQEASAQHPLLVLGLLFAVYVFVNTFSIPIATILALLVGALYGRLWGTLLLSFASMLGGCFTFLIARHLLKPWTEKIFSKQLNTLEQKWAGRGFVLLASLRIQPIFPYVLINFLFGLTPMNLSNFAWVSFFSLMPNTFVVVMAGERLSTIRGPQDIYRWDVLISLLLMAAVPKLLSKTLPLIAKPQTALKVNP